MKPRRQQVVYGPRPCHRCDGSGCERCGDTGFSVGPDHRPAKPEELAAPHLNWHGIQKGRA